MTWKSRQAFGGVFMSVQYSEDNEHREKSCCETVLRKT